MIVMIIRLFDFWLELIILELFLLILCTLSTHFEVLRLVNQEIVRFGCYECVLVQYETSIFTCLCSE